jgi:imidazoleglycerol phosphate synthase glutamine amidotransferase subunit HisH
MIAIVDYGRGNLGSVEKALGRLQMPAVVTQDPAVVAGAEAVVLPGGRSSASVSGISSCSPRAKSSATTRVWT